MNVYRIALALFFLLPFARDGIADPGSHHQEAMSRIVFLVH